MNVINKLFKIAVTFLILVSLSCSRSFLEPEPLSFFTPENVFVNEEGFESQLITLRKDLNREHTGQKNFIAHQWAADAALGPWLQLEFTRLTPTTATYQQFHNQIHYIFTM